jgi:hypothetical protein
MVCRASVALVVSLVTIGCIVIISDTGVERGSRLSPTTLQRCSCQPDSQRCRRIDVTHSESQVLGCEYSTEMLIVIDYKDAIGPLRSAELTRVRDGNGRRDLSAKSECIIRIDSASTHSESRQRPESRHGACRSLGRLLTRSRRPSS